MKPDPIPPTLETFASPPTIGRGSTRAAWIAHGERLAQANASLYDIILAAEATIQDRDAEISLLRAQIAARQPKGGRPRLEDGRVASIERDLAAGLSRRQAAARAGVAPATADRIAARAAARAGIS